MKGDIEQSRWVNLDLACGEVQKGRFDDAADVSEILLSDEAHEN